MRLMALLIVVTIIALTAAYYLGGMGSFDVKEQVREMKATLKLGMDWSDVIKAGYKPKRFCIIGSKAISGSGNPPVYIEKVGQPEDFDLQAFQTRFSNGDFPSGFTFFYVYSPEYQIHVYFDPAGKMTSLEQLPTIKDMLPY